MPEKKGPQRCYVPEKCNISITEKKWSTEMLYCCKSRFFEDSTENCILVLRKPRSEN